MLRLSRWYSAYEARRSTRLGIRRAYPGSRDSRRRIYAPRKSRFVHELQYLVRSASGGPRRGTAATTARLHHHVHRGLVHRLLLIWRELAVTRLRVGLRRRIGHALDGLAR